MNRDRLTIRIDVESKQALKLFANSVGLTSSRLVRVLIMQALRERRVLLLNKDPAQSVRSYIAKHKLTEDLESEED